MEIGPLPAVVTEEIAQGKGDRRCVAGASGRANVFRPAEHGVGMSHQQDARWGPHQGGRVCGTVAARGVLPKEEVPGFLRLDDPLTKAAGVHVPQGTPAGLQVTMTMPLIRFQMVTLGPFVPGIDKNESLAGGFEGPGLLNEVRQPVPEDLWGGVDEDMTRVLAPGRIVPGRHGGAEEGVVREDPTFEIFSRGQIVIHPAIKMGVSRGRLRVKRDSALMGRKLHGGVKAEVPGIGGGAKAFDAGEIDLTDARLLAIVTPYGGGTGGVWQEFDPVDQQQGPAVDTNVSTIAQPGVEVADVGQVVRLGIILTNQDFIILAIPTPRPIFIGPTDAERKIRLAGGQNVIDGLMQQTMTIEPIVVVAESIDTVAASQIRLGLANLGQAEVVKTQVRWQVGLLMACEIGLGPADIGPFGKALAPPVVVFRNGMKLGEVEGNQVDRVQIFQGR